MILSIKLDDSEIVDLIKKGGSKEDRAIKYLLKTQGEKIKQFVLNNGGNVEDAEETLYEALTAFVFNVRSGKFKEESSLTTYLYAIAKNVWYKAFDKKLNKKHHLEQYREWQDETIGFESMHLLEKSTREYVTRVLDRLHDKCKEVLLMWAQHFSMQEIAAQLGYKNAQIAMNKKSKCFKQLQTLLEHEPVLRKTLGELRFS